MKHPIEKARPQTRLEQPARAERLDAGTSHSTTANSRPDLRRTRARRDGAAGHRSGALLHAALANAIEAYFQTLFRALEHAPTEGGAGQLTGCVQYIMDDLVAAP
ncbi:MAG: hypothetical protein HC828_07720 [Blastochloris sp.]|nr:hypothetical protein [Blastochloris sp.]